MGKRVFLSEIQLVVADSGSEVQRWHLDAVGGPGLTVLVPLVPISADRAQQQVLPGSHWFFDKSLGMHKRLYKGFSALCRTHGAITTPCATGEATECWGAGDALVLDSRLLRRGLSNESFGAPAPLIIIRYD